MVGELLLYGWTSSASRAGTRSLENGACLNSEHGGVGRLTIPEEIILTSHRNMYVCMYKAGGGCEDGSVSVVRFQKRISQIIISGTPAHPGPVDRLVESHLGWSKTRANTNGRVVKPPITAFGMKLVGLSTPASASQGDARKPGEIKGPNRPGPVILSGDNWTTGTG
ncbi:uncharacterized protein CIMG_12862 [Coccidioides immitis RS]|uniref:Uncharacterized protein n=1 Tax=Coccidioides immitis (strain RS) TaxID=246410 RepID=A0A0D8JSN4_COCIM|nr:uncharacterized protein CIMG_12862 [Coccidioides immitis RS]KJF60297.1 hypothetical protein CIMG_12862 [Coccidioides immitis RS]